MTPSVRPADALVEPVRMPVSSWCPSCAAAGAVALLTTMVTYYVCAACKCRWQAEGL